MSTLSWILLFSFLSAILSVMAAASYLVLPQHTRQRMLPHLVSFATGALLAAAFLALLPHAIELSEKDVHIVTGTVLVGILLFFILEKLVLWRHCHHAECEVHSPEEHHHHKPRSGGMLVVIGDAVHNLVDGILIAAAFMTDVELGIVTAVAVAAHEIPQELGDFAILLHSGYSRLKALLFNILSSLTTVVGAVLAYYGLSGLNEALPIVLALAAASFIYVAVADLIPGLHRQSAIKVSLQQLFLIALGVGTIAWAHTWAH